MAPTVCWAEMSCHGHGHRHGHAKRGSGLWAVCSVQFRRRASTQPRHVSSDCSRLPILILILLLLEGWRAGCLFLPGQGRTGTWNGRRGAHSRTWGKSTWAYQQGGLPISVPSSRAAFRPLGGAASSLSLLHTPTCVKVCVCVYILSYGIHLWWCVLPRLIVSLSHQLRCGWPGYTKALRPSTTVACATLHTYTHSSGKALNLSRCLEPQRIP